MSARRSDASAGDSGIFHIAAASSSSQSPALAFDLVFEQDSVFDVDTKLADTFVQVALAFTRLSTYRSSGSSGQEKIYVERVLRVLTARARVAENVREVVISCNPACTSALLAAKVDAAFRGKMVAVSFDKDNSLPAAIILFLKTPA